MEKEVLQIRTVRPVQNYLTASVVTCFPPTRQRFSILYRVRLVPGCVAYGPPMKMLGKNTDTTCTTDYQKTYRQRTANRMMSNTYYTTHAALMKARVRTYTDRETVHCTGDTCVSNSLGDEVCPTTVVYKRSNDHFKTQGAVSSGLYLNDLNYNTIRVAPFNPLKKTQQPCSPTDCKF